MSSPPRIFGARACTAVPLASRLRTDTRTPTAVALASRLLTGARALTAVVLASGLMLSACASGPQTRPDTATAAPVTEGTAAGTPAAEDEAGKSAAEAPLTRPEPARGPARDFARAVGIAHRGELTAAEAALQALTREQPRLDYAWTNLGIVQERLGRPDDAERSYRQALAVAPEQEAAWDYLARLYGRTNRAVKLEAELRTLLESRTDSVPLRTALAITLLQQKKHESAANEAKLALKGDERHVRAMQVLAQVYYREGKYELSRMVLENARAIDAEDAATHNALGLVYLSLKARPQALESFKEAARLRPDFAEARNNFGALLNEAQDYPAAVTELEAAVRAAPDFASARLNLGNAYRGQGDFARARAEYEQVLKLRPDSADPLFNLAILYLDVEPPGVDTLERYKTVISYFEQYQGKGGRDERIDQYVKDARKGIEREERRRERERKDQLRKVEEQQKAEAEKAAAEKQAAEAQAAAEKAAAEKQATPAQPAAVEAPPPAPKGKKAAAPTKKARATRKKKSTSATADASEGTASPGAVSQPGSAPLPTTPSPAPAPAGSGKLANDSQ